MKKDAIYIAIIIILLSIVVVLTCSGPDTVDHAAEQYKDSVKVLQSQKAQISSRIEAVERAAIVRQKDDSAKLAAKEKEIARLKVKASQAVKKIPVKVIEENPEIMIAIEAKDSVIHELTVLTDTLKSQIAFERGVRESLMTMHYDSDKIIANLLELRSQRIITLEKDLKKEKRKGRFKAVLIPIVGVGMFLLGSAL